MGYQAIVVLDVNNYTDVSNIVGQTMFNFSTQFKLKGKIKLLETDDKKSKPTQIVPASVIELEQEDGAFFYSVFADIKCRYVKISPENLI